MQSRHMHMRIRTDKLTTRKYDDVPGHIYTMLRGIESETEREGIRLLHRFHTACSHQLDDTI